MKAFEQGDAHNQIYALNAYTIQLQYRKLTGGWGKSRGREINEVTAVVQQRNGGGLQGNCGLWHSDGNGAIQEIISR